MLSKEVFNVIKFITVHIFWQSNNVNLFQNLKFKIFVLEPAPPSAPVEPPLPRMKKKDLTLKELKKYDGTGKDGRVLVGVLGKIYDVTKGKHFYGPGKIKNEIMFKIITNSKQFL